jgi:hypothetical protein
VSRTVSDNSHRRTNFPIIDRFKAVADEWSLLRLADASFSSETLADQMTRAGFPIGASTIRTYRRNLLSADIDAEVAAGKLPRVTTLDRSALYASNILCFDIETIPATVTTYDLKPNWISHKNVVTPGEMLCWSAGWYHEPGKVSFMDRQHEGYDGMLIGLWNLLDKASYVVGWNSDRFDLKKVRGYFARAGLPPFRPPKSIDLVKAARTFGFESASLDYTARMFGVRRKVDNGGAANWQRCMAGEEEAWALMKEYNEGDVLATIDMFDALRPWIPNHPHMGFAADDEKRCPRCGSDDLTDVGVTQAVVIRYRMHRCGNCGGLSRSTIHSRASVTRAV